jgi:glutamate N-acetyltransferase/amino-acid N-acetyltransferase
MERITRGRAQAILVNSGVANACTGKTGMEAAQTSSALAAAALNINENLVQIASTGVIGEQLPVNKLAAAMDELITGLAPGAGDKVARAIMTTDTVPKTAGRTSSPRHHDHGYGSQNRRPDLYHIRE